MISLFGSGSSHLHIMRKNSIMHLKLEGVIIDGEKFLKQLKKYREEKDIKAFVVEINSPGGVVGPSQEIFEELKRTRTEFEKPVVAVSTSMIASGAYYAAMGTDKLIVAPGTMVGSIGVIMEFANLEGLYSWAKVSRYTITTGKYKDSGAEYRAMRDDEREIFQAMINEVWVQFKEAVAEGRKLKMEEVEPYADGRVITGATAIKLGFADQVGTTDSAFKEAAKLANLGDNYEIFEIPKRRPGVFDFLDGLGGENEDEAIFGRTGEKILGRVLGHVARPELLNRPLFLMPGNW